MPRSALLLVALLTGCHLVLPLSSREETPADLGPKGDRGPAADGPTGDGPAADLSADGGAPPICPPTPAVDTDTRALFTFEGATPLTDLTGKHTMVLHTQAAVTTETCGDVVSFPGLASSYGEIAHSAVWDTIVSLDLWFKHDQPSTDEQDLLSRDANNAALPGHFTLTSSGGYLLARLQDDAGNQYYRCHPMPLDGEWHHVGVNFGSPDLEMVVDGAPVQATGTSVDIQHVGTVDCSLSTTKTIAGNQNPWVVGAGSRVSSEGQANQVTLPWRGSIDNLRFSSARREFDAVKLCQARYGAAQDYVLCAATAATCTFSAWTELVGCGALCAQHGGTCFDAWDNPNDTGSECQKLAVLGCAEKIKQTNLCLCSL